MWHGVGGTPAFANDLGRSWVLNFVREGVEIGKPIVPAQVLMTSRTDGIAGRYCQPALLPLVTAEAALNLPGLTPFPGKRDVIPEGRPHLR
jgi:hypothetical protein